MDTEETQVVTPETNSEEVKTAEVENNYEVLVKQQQAQLEQLIKQQEITNKVNQQLVNQLNNLSKGQAISSPEEHWVDKVLREDFQHEAKIDPIKNQLEFFNRNTKQIAVWWLRYLKDKGLSNDEIATRYYNMANGIESELDRNQ